MKFRRNVKEEKLFHRVAIGGLVLLAVLLIVYLTTHDNVLLDLLVPALLIPPISFFISNSMKKDFVEINENEVVLINGNGYNITIDTSDIEAILIPSSKALKNKVKGNAIVVKRSEIKNIFSYSSEIEQYIKETLPIRIVYYDDYSQVIK